MPQTLSPPASASPLPVADPAAPAPPGTDPARRPAARRSRHPGMDPTSRRAPSAPHRRCTRGRTARPLYARVASLRREHLPLAVLAYERDLTGVALVALLAEHLQRRGVALGRRPLDLELRPLDLLLHLLDAALGLAQVHLL